MIHYVYLLYSEKIDRYYIGYSEDPIKRLEFKHNLGYVKATRIGIPYVLCKMKAFPNEIQAIQEERRLKRMKSRVYLEQLISGNW